MAHFTAALYIGTGRDELTVDYQRWTTDKNASEPTADTLTGRSTVPSFQAGNAGLPTAPTPS